MPRSDTHFKRGNTLGVGHGRPPKTVERRDLALITKLAARGVREKDIARCVNMSEPTWIKTKNADRAVRAAFDAGRQVMHDKLVGKLFERAMKGEYVPALFLLKTVFGYREGDEPSDVRPQITINLPGAAKLAEYKPRVIEHNDE